MGAIDSNAWQTDLCDIARDRRRVMVVGAADTGKTTFCRALVTRYLEAGLRTALIDNDVGQSTLGPPTTVGMKVYAPSDQSAPTPYPDRIEFVGSTTPERHLLQTLSACVRCSASADEAGAKAIVLDTTGLVRGPGALALKLEKARLYGPDAVAAIQRGREIESLLTPLVAQGLPVVRVGVSALAASRSSIQRRAIRREMFRQFFESAQTVQTDFERLPILPHGPGLGEALSEDDLATLTGGLGVAPAYAERCGSRLFVVTAGAAGAARKPAGYEEVVVTSKQNYQHMLLGLSDGAQTVGLGIVLEFDTVARTMTLLMGLQHACHADSAVAGEIRLLEDGTELERASRPRWLT